MEIEVKAQIGDEVAAGKPFRFTDSIYGDAGDVWTVTDKHGLFVHIEREGMHIWLGDTSFIDIFEGGWEGWM